MKLVIAASTIAAVLGPVSAHSWIEEMQAIGQNGSYVGDHGYTRGYVARTDPGFTGDSMNYLLPPLSSGRTRIDDTDLLCHPSQRSTNGYTNPDYPRLKISPGGYIALKYLENGHVTLPENQKGKPKDGGSIFIFGTTSPTPNEKIADVMKWTKDGSGGDKRGFLLGSNNFDDGRCHQINSGAISIERQQQFPDRVAGQPTSNVEQWCETDIQIPASQKSGQKLSLYWVWQWPTEPGQDPTYPQGKDEYYTSCADVDVVAGSDMSGNQKVVAAHTLVQQDPQSDAVESWKSRVAVVSSPTVILASATGSGPAAAPSVPAPSSPAASVPVSSPAAVPSSAAPSAPASSIPGIPTYPSSQPQAPPQASAQGASQSAPVQIPSQGPPASGNTVTVTDYATVTATPQVQAANAQQATTTTEWVTTYVTAMPSVVLESAPVAAGGASSSGAPPAAAVPVNGSVAVVGIKFRS